MNASIAAISTNAITFIDPMIAEMYTIHITARIVEIVSEALT
jgi:hypothetical protein